MYNTMLRRSMRSVRRGRSKGARSKGNRRSRKISRRMRRRSRKMTRRITKRTRRGRRRLRGGMEPEAEPEAEAEPGAEHVTFKLKHRKDRDVKWTTSDDFIAICLDRIRGTGGQTSLTAYFLPDGEGDKLTLTVTLNKLGCVITSKPFPEGMDKKTKLSGTVEFEWEGREPRKPRKRA